MGSALFGLGWLSIAKTDEVITVVGKLKPLGSVQDIQMPVGGIASEILVNEGEEAKPKLLRLTQKQPADYRH